METGNDAGEMLARICGDPSIAEEVRKAVESAGEPRPVDMREALEICRDELSDLLEHWGPFGQHVESKLKELVVKCEAGLAQPRRNCDVGTAGEQLKRQHDTMCNTTKACPDSDWSCRKCFAEWAQMPYEEPKSKKE